MRDQHTRRRWVSQAISRSRSLTSRTHPPRASGRPARCWPGTSARLWPILTDGHAGLAHRGVLQLRPQVAKHPARRIPILALAVFLLIGLAQSPAHAAVPPYNCTEAVGGDIWTDEYGFKFVCRRIVGTDIWRWVIVISMDGIKSNAKLFTTSNPKSYQVVSVGLRTGSGGGIYEGGQTIADANGNDMSRPMKTRVVLNYYTGSAWVNCHDTGWIDNGTRNWSHNGLDMGAVPDCGTALYGVKTAGIYYSSTAGWLGGTWVLSGNLALGGVVAYTNVPPMPDTPLNLPPPPQA